MTDAVRAEIVLPRQVRRPGADLDDRTWRGIVQVEPGEVMRVEIPVEVVFGIGTTVVTDLFLVIVDGDGERTVYADSEPTIIDTRCAEATTSESR